MISVGSPCINFRPVLFIVGVLVFTWACTGEDEPVEIAGDWKVNYWEVSGCLDSTKNFSRNLTLDDCILDVDSLTRCFNYILSFADNNAFSSSLVVTEDSTNIVEDRTGEYFLIDNNNMVLCSPACDTLLFIREGDILNLIMRTDSLTGCGEYLRSTLIQ